MDSTMTSVDLIQSKSIRRSYEIETGLGGSLRFLPI